MLKFIDENIPAELRQLTNQSVVVYHGGLKITIATANFLVVAIEESNR